MFGSFIESIKNLTNEIKDLSTTEKIAIIGAFIIGLFLGYEVSRGFSDLIFAITNLTKRKVRSGGTNGSEGSS